MPFVCLNLPNTISKLEKNFGFDFSDSTFGHEYDTIQNYDERLDVIKTKGIPNMIGFNIFSDT